MIASLIAQHVLVVWWSDRRAQKYPERRAENHPEKRLKRPKCPKHPERPDWDLREGDDQVDLDELEGSKPPMLRPTEVFIGRTDYHITIHTQPSSKHRIPIQNLSFSTYSPNNQDNILQGSYQNTKDDPRPRLAAILPKLTHTTSKDQLLPHLDSVYVGLVEDTGSLFAMSPDRFPLVAFSGGRAKNRVKVIDVAVDAITAEGKRRENAMKERNYGSEDDRSSLHTDQQCLVRIHLLKSGDGMGLAA
ncbi:hypothetical protein B0H14DRAFT_3593010 [Mycena olivaceomarginata]|nr:hypothetical protein B0H14DRAFT_3593010 [Mycena olivaceomarginata]